MLPVPRSNSHTQWRHPPSTITSHKEDGYKSKRRQARTSTIRNDANHMVDISKLRQCRTTTTLKLLTVSFIIYHKEHDRKYCKSQTDRDHTLAINPCMINKKPHSGKINEKFNRSTLGRRDGQYSSTSVETKSHQLQ